MNFSAVCLSWLLIFAVIISAGDVADRRDDNFIKRQQNWLEEFAGGDLPSEMSTNTWVDSERWAIAHAYLATGVNLDKANRYFETIKPVSMWRGLIADTDVQVTDLLRSYLEFHGTGKLSEGAEEKLRTFFKAWEPPNPDRNRFAKNYYEWPCEYTENHSLNIIVASYLIDFVLGRDRQKSKKLVEEFMLDRAKYGWSEFHSPSYMLVTAKALSCLFDFAPDKNISQYAMMLLDILTMEYSLQCLREWRGVPFVRGYGGHRNNNSSSAVMLFALWWGDEKYSKPQVSAVNPFVVHLLTSKYYPPQDAIFLARNPEARGIFTMKMLGTTGPGKIRVPMVMWVSPDATMASSQGYGSYYDGCYWTISFASSPADVITGDYYGGRNLLQIDNILAVFGSVEWYGSIKKQNNGNISFAENGNVFIGQIDLAEDVHILTVDVKNKYRSIDEFLENWVKKTNPRWENGVLSFLDRDGQDVKMINVRNGDKWKFHKALINDRELRLDNNILYECKFMQSVRESAIYYFVRENDLFLYDLHNPQVPIINLSKNYLPQLSEQEKKGPLGMNFIWIPAGEFPMGSPITEGRVNERPQKWVFVPDFYISTTEVTVGQYKQFLAENKQFVQPPDWYWKEWGVSDNHAMTWVTWEEANEFCKWMSIRYKKKYRLPSEAEWEKAAKGFTHRVYPWGDEYNGAQAGTPNGTYMPVGSHPLDRSPFGVLDMAGGVWEWCSDEWKIAGSTDDQGMATNEWRSLRSCGWNYDPDTFRCSYRSGAPSSLRSVHIGFRVVCEGF